MAHFAGLRLTSRGTKPLAKEQTMDGSVYTIIELTGTSSSSVEQAVQNRHHHRRQKRAEHVVV